MIRKTYLVSYKKQPKQYFALNSDVVSIYLLSLKTVWFGLITTYKVIEMPIRFYENEQKTLKRYNELIKTKTALK